MSKLLKKVQWSVMGKAAALAFATARTVGYRLLEIFPEAQKEGPPNYRLSTQTCMERERAFCQNEKEIAAELLAKAVKLYQQSAEAGDAEAMYNLSLVHVYGWGRAKDEARAVELFQQASEAGSAEATSLLQWLGDREGRGES